MHHCIRLAQLLSFAIFVFGSAAYAQEEAATPAPADTSTAAAPAPSDATAAAGDPAAAATGEPGGVRRRDARGGRGGEQAGGARAVRCRGSVALGHHPRLVPRPVHGEERPALDLQCLGSRGVLAQARQGGSESNLGDRRVGRLPEHDSSGRLLARPQQGPGDRRGPRPGQGPGPHYHGCRVRHPAVLQPLLRHPLRRRPGARHRPGKGAPYLGHLQRGDRAVYRAEQQWDDLPARRHVQRERRSC